MKESNNLAFMFTLVESPLGAPPVTTQSFCDSTHEFGCLIVLCCGFPLLHHQCLKGIHEGQKFLGHFVHHFWTCFFPCFRKLVHFLHSEAYLPPFPLFMWFKGRIKECTFPLDSNDKWKSMCSCDSSLGLGTFSFLLFFFGVVGIFTCLGSSLPLSDGGKNPSFLSFSYFCMQGPLQLAPPSLWCFEPLLGLLWCSPTMVYPKAINFLIVAFFSFSFLVFYLFLALGFTTTAMLGIS